MRKFVLLAALLAVLVAAALPAFADNKGKDHKRHHGGGGGGGGGGESALHQDSEQEGEAGDLDQSFTVTNEGDNSNQCVGIQGVGNTGNAQNLIPIIQYASETEDVELDEVNSSIEMNPTNTTECTGEVNQAASASGGGGGTPVKKY
jgi:hypothetical protein